ncbi:hypothetical protein [Bradyrhizobium sp. BWA-3-5]|uniref:hypothetical protein n=1 Tax=Bradyrhizobium sp. BWA-3-5 TaxID=3080013 RepID=UPI00293F2E02|nr:hypothetical protein [Bradyrhizobium sp. BWA-3-5]WOH66167.1 hypothetical protein RX331_37595 [Bradyrhizobium sp. BWA-3-5]
MNSLVSISLAGATPVAAPAMQATDRRALEAYASWLHMERRLLCLELWPHMGSDAEKYVWADNAGYHWHFRGEGDWRDLPQPSTRAAAVLDLVGVDWKDRSYGNTSPRDNEERPALPAGWPETDPILTAIGNHKAAVAAYNALCVQQDRLEAEIPQEVRRSKYADEEMADTDDPRWIAFQNLLQSLSDAEVEAECQLANIAPTTLAGVIALLSYAVEVERDLGFREIYFDPDEPNQKMGRSWYYFVNRNLVETLKSIAA